MGEFSASTADAISRSVVMHVCLWSVINRQTGGCVGSENDTLLPLTMTHDENVEMIHLGVKKLSSGNLDGGRNFLYLFFDKTIRHSRWGMHNYTNGVA